VLDHEPWFSSDTCSDVPGASETVNDAIVAHVE
jgi:hypothetical protein